MLRCLALIGLAACSSVFGIAKQTDDPDASTACSLRASFGDNLIDPAIWQIADPVSPVTIVADKGVLAISVPADTPGKNSLVTTQAYELDGRSIGAWFHPSTDASAMTSGLQLELDGDNFILAYYQVGTLTLYVAHGTEIQMFGFPYDPIADRSWRVDVNPLTIALEVSEDGSIWNEFTSAENPFAAAVMTVALFVDTGVGASATQRVSTFDDVEVCPL